jgi:hypothetical protein
VRHKYQHTQCALLKYLPAWYWIGLFNACVHVCITRSLSQVVVSGGGGGDARSKDSQCYKSGISVHRLQWAVIEGLPLFAFKE